MAIIDLTTADGNTIGNPSTGSYYVFLDSTNSDLLTTRDDAGLDTVYASGAIPTQLNNLIDVNIGSPSLGQFLRYNGSQWANVSPPIYGTEFHSYSNAPLISTTSTVSTTVINETTTSIPLGDYEITISANV